jgi:hypothetical protein
MGAVGTALGYALLMVARGGANIVVSNRILKWLPGISWRMMSVLLLCVSSVIVGLVSQNMTTRLALVCVILMAVMLVLSGQVIGVTEHLLSYMRGESGQS